MPLTSSPFWIRRLELMMILWPLSKVTTSATQFGAHEWLMYLESTMAYAAGGGGMETCQPLPACLTPKEHWHH